MVRETRHLWVGNLPDNVREDRIREHFKRYGRVQSVKLLSRNGKEEATEGAMACTVAFMDIKSASKAHNAEHKFDDRTLTTEYYEPAAIPSAASPQSTPSSYSTSPGSTRFPNGHGSTEEHANFGERFYERPNNRVAEGDFIRRTNYHENCRGRNRERSYRNGPYNAIMDRSHRTLNNSWSSSYDARYNSQNETGYVSTPSDSNERRSSDQSTKKKAKSRSGSRSPSPSGSTSSRSHSRSRSRSSSSSSSSSTSQDTGSSSEKRPVAIRVKNLPPRSSDTSLKDGLFHEYKKHGKVTWVKVVGQGAERYAIVCFKKPEDVEKALEVSYDKLFFGCKIEVEPYQGYDVEDNDLRPYEAEIDEFHPKATRTLFIGNLEKDVTASDLRKHFDPFGEIIEIDIKKQGSVGSYAFCQYTDIASVVRAIRAMDGEHLGGNRVKLGFGKSMPTNCVWLDGLAEVSDKYLRMHFEPFGAIGKVHVDREKGQALVFYEQVGAAQLAVNKMRGFIVKGSKMQVDFASRECQESFFEHLEKQGTTVVDRSGFEERRDSVSRTFDASTARFATRHFRNYDEFSQGSGASHDEYDHEYPFSSPPHLDATPAQSGEHPSVPFAQPDIRNLQKERVHLLEQLEECPSSGDELIGSKKRLKLEVLEGAVTSDVIIEANRDHRKVMEVRRLSDPNVKHHSRRPSVDNKHCRGEMAHDRGSYLPHTICKRRKTAGSDNGSKTHHYDHSGSESVGGSRPGTPLVDERPEHFTPSEPRRIPREREGPLTLPLPRFAAQIMSQRGSISVAGIKGQKDGSVLSSPPPAAITSPRISNPLPAVVPPPDSPPPRPPSLASNSSGDSRTPSPSLDERIKSLVEKYEKWSGSRALGAAGTEVPVEGAREKFRLRHKLLDLDLKEVQPSEIVKSVMAKRSVFDEDLKRLENVGEKYEPKEFSSFARVTTNVQITIPPAPSSAPPIPTATQLPKTPTLLSPRSAGANVTTAKGLQYPFPSHPPVTPTVLHPQPPPPAATPVTPPPTRSANHGDANRLKPCASAPADARTPSKVSVVNRSAAVTPKSDKNTSVNIPSASTDTSPCVIAAAADKLTVKTVGKASEKIGDRVTSRRDSSSSSSPRCDAVKSRRNSDARAKEDNEKFSEKVENDKPPEDKSKNDERKEQHRLEKIRLENEKLERERLEKEKQEKERLEKEKLERERLERENELEKERLEKERIEREKRKEREERERREKEERERREREEHERQEREKREQEEKLKREEEERLEKERQEKERIEKERAERERRREEEKKHKEESHEKRKDEHRHRENLGDSKYRDSNHLHDSKSSKEHESKSGHEKSRHHERDVDRRKDSVKENRDNNVHEKQKVSENKIESRHLSIDLERNKSFDALARIEFSKRKERNNSLPANVGVKRRLSTHDSTENIDEAKKIKLGTEHKKLSERRDSKDSTRSEGKVKDRHKSNTKLYEEKSKHNNVKDCDDKRKDRDERHKSKQLKLDKYKIKSKSREKECRESPSTPKSPSKELTDKDFLAKLDLRSNEDVEKQKRFESKDKRKQEEDEKKHKEDMKRFESKKDKHSLEKSKSREDSVTSRSDDKKSQKKERPRKLTHNSSDNSDSDEPKKHSIFDIVDDEPAYISMYDKVKARSCKNMQKQEEEKRQEKIKAKFSQLKQSRAKREEKKRSTSWDEDSESDREKNDHKGKRGNKMLIMSSDEDETIGKTHKKRDIYTDSDSERHGQIKSEHNEISEDDRFRSKLQRKGSRSRIPSDTSDDEIKKIHNQIIKPEFSDNDVDQGFGDLDEKPFSKIKEEFNRVIKKSKEKHQEVHVDQMSAQIFGDSPLMDVKVENFNNRHSFGENSSTEEGAERKERSEIRKKHKKKQKRQKHSLSSEECNKVETIVDGIFSEATEKVKHDKRKQHSKKEKRRDKSKEDRDKSKKSKKSKSDKSDAKRDGKIENIFGSLSEDSEGCVKDSEPSDNKSSLFHGRFSEINYASDSDREVEKSYKSEEKGRDSKEEHKKRKEKKRREKERRLLEEAVSGELVNENSMDYADMGKQLEANIKDDSMEGLIKQEVDSSHEAGDDSFRLSEDNDFHEIKKEDKREPREKKKKRKKSKEEKQKHHHHHHHEKSKVKTELKEVKKEPVEEPKIEAEENKSQSQSLPSLLDITPSPPQNKSSSSLDFSISPISRETLISPIPKTPTTSKEKKREKFLPGFGGTEIDEKVHETAIKSISEFETSIDVAKPAEEAKSEPNAEPTEEKPRVVISQEETEDAVAALLGESFGSGQFEECYEEETANNEQTSNDDNITQDDEEMRQAVQSLSTADIDIKPETPQSEHELQIDTDTEEPEETNVRFDPPPKAPEVSEPATIVPKTPSFYKNDDLKPVKTPINIGSPPSLTPLKPQLVLPAELKRVEDTKTSQSLPLLPEPPRSVISQIWNIEKKDISKPEPVKVATVMPSVVQTQAKPTNSPLRTFASPTIVKISETTYPPLAALTKQEHPQISSVPEQVKVQTYAVLQSTQKPVSPAVSQKPSTSVDSTIPLPSKIATGTSRLPISPIMVSKPMQATTVLLPQAKMAHSLEPPVLVSASDPRPQERPRMVFQTAPTITSQYPNLVQSQPRMVVQTNLAVNRSLPPQGLLVPTRQLPPSSYGYMNSMPPNTYNLTTAVNKDNLVVQSDNKPPSSTQAPAIKPPIIMSTYSHPIQSNSVITSKPFMHVIKEAPPKLVSLPEIRISQPSAPQQKPVEEKAKEISDTEADSLKLAQDINRSPTPSPVIVQAPIKEQDKKPVAPCPELPPAKQEEPPKQLAIEKVTEELNLSLKKEMVETKDELEISKEPKEASTPEVKAEEKTEDIKPKPEIESKTDPITETEVKKEETLANSDKDKSLVNILTSKDDPLDNKEDSDYWSAKEVNIDSVIKTLCSADELSDHSSETGKDEWLEDTKANCGENKVEDSTPKPPGEISEELEPSDDTTDEAARAGVNRRGGRARGRKTRGGLDRSGIQTRRSKLVKDVGTPAKRGGRGGCRQKGERKLSKSESEITSDVYEFHDDSDENNKERPRLILTIKSPAAVNAQPVVKDVAKEVVKEEVSPKPADAKEEFVSPASNTRKSRRLQERDVLRNTVDDTIEDVVRNTVMVTRSLTNQAARRSGRQAVVSKVTPETPKKPARGGRKKDRRASDPAEDSSEEKSKIESDLKQEVECPEIDKNKSLEKPESKTEVKDKPLEGLKVKMLRRVKGDMALEPTNLIDPVTGLLMPMRECEEGRYIPLPKTQNENQQKSVITSPQPLEQQSANPQKPKPQSLKAHVLSSQAAKSQQIPQPPQPQPLQVKKSSIIVSHPVVVSQPAVVKPNTPLNQALNVNVSIPTYTTSHISPRPSVANKPLPILSPSHMPVLTPQQKQMLQVNKAPTLVPSKSLAVNQAQLINTQVAHMKQQPQAMKQAVINKNKPTHNIHQQQILTGSVASPPLKGPIPGMAAGASQNRIVQGPSLPKGVMDPPKIDVSLSNAILGPRSNLSPQGQPRHMAQSGMPVPGYEASLGEAIAHFPPGAVPIRSPHDLPPGHYMHSHLMQLQFMRQQPYHMPRSPMMASGLEKSGDGQEGEEAPVTSPPVELRRPGSVGMALTGRTPTAVPHPLHSPHDRTTDSPQVGQPYSIHSNRMPHYHPSGRYYEQISEPPPAHRPLTSHGSLTALANERPHLPDRPIGGHLQPDRPLSSHSALAAHMGTSMGAGLGAAGNLMGAVARHVGGDAPASQRGTPPHASQVPPQAESLFMLLKQYPCMWQGLLALKNDQAAVQMYFVSGNDLVAKSSLPKNTDGSTPPLRIFQRMRLEPPQVEGVARKMQMENEHCMLLALPCGHDHMDVLKQSTNLTSGFITYLQQKQAAGIVNVAAPGTTQPPAYVVHIFPSCDFVNENLRRIAPSLLERVADIAHLLIVITTV